MLTNKTECDTIISQDRQGGVTMSNLKELELTKDPLANINIIFPLLNERSKEAVSHLMFGCYLGESIAKGSQRDKQLQEV